VPVIPIAEIENDLAERKTLVDGMRSILGTARTEKRDLTAEEATEYDRMEADVRAIRDRVKRHESMNELDEELERGIRRKEPEVDDKIEEEETFLDAISDAGYRSAFMDFMRHQRPKSESMDLLSGVRAAYQVGTPSEGGYTVPETWRRQLIETRTQFGVLRQLATIITTTSGELIHIPKVTDAQVATAVAEEGAYTESEDTFDEMTLSAYKYGILVKISEELLEDSLFDLQAFIIRRAGRALGLKEGALYATGDGTGDPTGITVAATVGKTLAATNAVTAPEILDWIHSVAPPYRPGAQFVMHDNTVLAIAKLEDANDQWLWQPGLQAGEPDRIRGYPLYIDPFYDDVGDGVSKIIGTFGDHSEYYIREVGAPYTQRLNELFAVNGQIGFRFRIRVDGNLADTAAVKSLKTAAS
jgi:HK97 family phage major capsid protein